MRGANILFNLITFIFVVLTLVVLVYALAIAGGMVEPPFLAPPTDFPTPTLVDDLDEELPTPFLPTFTPSHTPEPTATPEPSATPPPPTPEPTVPPTDEAAPEGGGAEQPGESGQDGVGSAALAALPGFTATAPPAAAPRRSPTPTITLTPGPPPTSTVTPTPPGPPPSTLSPFPFIVQPGTPLLRESFADGTTGCAWQGLAGTVVDQRGEAVVGVEVRVSGDTIGEQIALSGTDTDYGPSGWEVRVSGAPGAGRYTVSLWSGGRAVSPGVEVQFPGTCAQNLALVNFVQTRTF